MESKEHFSSHLSLFGGTVTINQHGFINPGLTLQEYEDLAHELCSFQPGDDFGHPAMVFWAEMPAGGDKQLRCQRRTERLVAGAHGGWGYIDGKFHAISGVIPPYGVWICMVFSPP